MEEGTGVLESGRFGSRFQRLTSQELRQEDQEFEVILDYTVCVCVCVYARARVCVCVYVKHMWGSLLLVVLGNPWGLGMYLH